MARANHAEAGLPVPVFVDGPRASPTLPVPFSTGPLDGDILLIQQDWA